MNKIKKEIRKTYFLNGNTTEITYQKPKRIITEEYDPHGNITLHRIEEVIDGKFVVSPKSKIFENQHNILNKLSNVKVFQNHKMIRQKSFFYHHFGQKYISIISEYNVGGLQLTITAEGDGYVAIRHQNFVGDYARKEYANESQFAEILKNKDYGRPYPKYWLGQKNFKEYGKTEDQIVKSIISEIESLKTDFDKVK